MSFTFLFRCQSLARRDELPLTILGAPGIFLSKEVLCESYPLVSYVILVSLPFERTDTSPRRRKQ